MTIHKVKLYSVESDGKEIFFHKNSIAGFWEDKDNRGNARSAIMLTSGREIVFSDTLVELINLLKSCTEFELPN